MTEAFDSEKINKYFKGVYSEKDTSYIDDIFCDDTKEDELRRLLSRQFDDLLPGDEIYDKNLDHILYRIHYDINMQKQEQKNWSLNQIMKWTARIASVIILPLALFVGIYIYKDTLSKRETWVEIKAPAWTRAQFMLPDGTTGWLNSNSSIKYKGNFTSDRQLTLTGEAFFDVYENKKRPFMVNTDDLTIKVLGTRFNVASYENEKNIEVVLEEGKLEVSDNNLKESYKINPNHLVVYDKTLKVFSTEIVQPQVYCSWTEGKLVFRNDSLAGIARRLEKWYNIDVEIENGLDSTIRWRATFIDEPLEEVLIILKHSLSLEYTIENSNLMPDETFAKRKVIITQKRN